MRGFFLIKHHPRGLNEVYEENPHQKCDLPDTRTIVPTLSNVKCRVVFWFCPLHCWRLTIARLRAASFIIFAYSLIELYITLSLQLSQTDLSEFFFSGQPRDALFRAALARSPRCTRPIK